MGKIVGFEPTWVTPLHSKTILNCFETESFTGPIFSWKNFFQILRLAINGTVCTYVENSTADAGVATQLISAYVSADACFTSRNFVAHSFRIIRLVAKTWFCFTLRVSLSLHSTENSALLGLHRAYFLKDKYSKGFKSLLFCFIGCKFYSFCSLVAIWLQ